MHVSWLLGKALGKQPNVQAYIERDKSLACLGQVYCAWNGGVFFTWTNATRPISIASQKNPCLIPQTRLTSPFLARCLSFRAHLMATSFACFCYMSCPSSRLWCLSCSLLYLHMPRLLDSAQICGEWRGKVEQQKRLNKESGTESHGTLGTKWWSLSATALWG